MWQSKTKTDLIIEVWEKLDCESIGENELVAIETVVRAEYGDSAVDNPMIVARLLADEGAELRHSEVMNLHVKRLNDMPYAPVFRNVFNIEGISQALSSIRKVENLRRKFSVENDKKGLRLLRNAAIAVKTRAQSISNDQRKTRQVRFENAEIAEWLTIWLQSPEVFENWVKLRQESQDFKEKFQDNALIDKDVF
jgi:hypothetical protein